MIRIHINCGSGRIIHIYIKIFNFDGDLYQVGVLRKLYLSYIFHLYFQVYVLFSPPL